MSSGEIVSPARTLEGQRATCRIGIILGSTRPNRNGEQVARWVFDIAAERADAEFELIDLRAYPLSHLDEPNRPETMDEAMCQASSEYELADWRSCPEDVDPVAYIRAHSDGDSHMTTRDG